MANDAAITSVPSSFAATSVALSVCGGHLEMGQHPLTCDVHRSLPRAIVGSHLTYMRATKVCQDCAVLGSRLHRQHTPSLLSAISANMYLGVHCLPCSACVVCGRNEALEA